MSGEIRNGDIWGVWVDGNDPEAFLKHFLLGWYMTVAREELGTELWIKSSPVPMHAEIAKMIHSADEVTCRRVILHAKRTAERCSATERGLWLRERFMSNPVVLAAENRLEELSTAPALPTLSEKAQRAFDELERLGWIVRDGTRYTLRRGSARFVCRVFQLLSVHTREAVYSRIVRETGKTADAGWMVKTASEAIDETGLSQAQEQEAQKIVKTASTA